MILKNDPRPIGPPVFLGKDRKLSIFVAGQSSIAVADPPVPVTVPVKCMDGVARKAIFNGVAVDDPAVANLFQPVLCTYKQGAVGVFRGNENRIVRLVGAQLDRLDFSVPQNTQSLVGADPNALVAALVDAPYQVIGHAHLAVVRRELHVPALGQPAGLRANPKVSFAVPIVGVNPIAVVQEKAVKGLRLQPSKATSRSSNHQISGLVFIQ